jgi:hypothetical protein
LILLASKQLGEILKASPRAAIAALGDVVRMTGDDGTGETGHAALCASGGR